MDLSKTDTRDRNDRNSAGAEVSRSDGSKASEGGSRGRFRLPAFNAGGGNGGNMPIVWYCILSFVLIMLLNSLLVPALAKMQVREVGYSEFVSMVEAGEVASVALDESASEIVFVTEGESPSYYKTGLFPDEGLYDRLDVAGVEFGAEIPTQSSPLLSFLLFWVLPVVFFFLVGRMLVKHMGRDGGNVMSFGKSNPKIVAETDLTTRFEDVAGQEEAKEALAEVVDFLHNPQKYESIGAKLPKGALLVGPPGTGKTLLARAVAGEAKVPFFSMSGSEFVEMFVGMGASKMRDLFKQANEKAPCIVFIDEIDAIGKKRDGRGMGGNDEREQTLNQLLTEMDGFDSAKGVVIMAATNRPESLDPALLRPGRFDRRIPVQLPDLAGREAVLKVHARGVKVDPSVDYRAVARATSGASGADLANIVNEAALRAVRMGRGVVLQEDLQESVEVVVAGHQRKNAVMTEEEKRIVAYHEIGHALVAARQKGSAPVTKITIVPRTSGALGYTMQVEEDERFLMSKEEIEGRIATLAGGRAAEELVFGTATTGASNDIEKATKLARAMVARYGMSEEFGMFQLEAESNQYLGGDVVSTCSAETAALVDRRAMDVVREAKERADAILREDEAKLHGLAAHLLERESITGEEFMSILNAR